MKPRVSLDMFCAAIMLMMCSEHTFAMFAVAPEVPVERLLKNVTAYVQENPKNPQGYYLLGRINALAFDRKARKVRAQEKPRTGAGKLPWLDPWQGKPKPDEKPLTEKQLQKHLIDSIKNYHKAIKLKNDEGIYHLGLGWVLESGVSYAIKIGAPPGDKTSISKPADGELKKMEALVRKLGHENYKVREAARERLRTLMPNAAGALLKHTEDEDPEVKARVETLLCGYWRDKAVEHYLRAYELTVKMDLKIKHRPARGLTSLVSYEAGQSWIRLVKQRGVKETEKKTLAQVEKDLQAIKTKPIGVITPIIFSLELQGGLGELLAEDKVVPFDLDGTGRPQLWQWVKPTTGILVWDPNDRGKITSGRQLFGSVSWWMFWRDGYHALNALDDDRDDLLRGAELQGLAVWFDRNSNGASEFGEVVKLASLDIVAIMAKATDRIGEVPFNPSGLKLRNGKVLPSYDWMPEPVTLPRTKE